MSQITHFLNQFGPASVFLGIFLESFGLPLPGETILIAASLLASRGHLNIYWIVALGFVAAVLGDSLGYAIGFFGGRPLLRRYGAYVFLDEKKLARFESFFERYGAKIVTVARFFAGLRQFNGLIAGAGRMPFRRFFLFNTIGAALWVGFWSGSVYWLGNRYEQVAGILKDCEWGVLAISAVIAAVLICVFLKKKHHN